jgi:hypothetical protein
MSELDRFRRAVPGFERASDEDVVREISRRTNQPFEQLADDFGLPVRGFASEFGRQLGAGFAVDTPEIIGGALQYFGSRREEPTAPFARRLGAQTGLERRMLGQPEPEESLAFRAGAALREGARERAPGWEPDLRGRGQTAQYALQGIRATAPVLAGLAPALLPGGQGISAAVLPTAFAGSAAQDTYERLIEQGVSEEEAAKAARGVFGLNLAGETLGTVATLGAAKAIAPVFRGPRTTAEVARRATDRGVILPALGAVAANLPVQVGTELVQELGGAEIERMYGGEAQDLGQLALDTAAVSGFMTLFLGPLSFGGARARARRSEELKQALYGENVDPQVRAQAIDVIMAEAQRQNIAPQDINAWFEQQLQNEDARTAALAAAEERAAAQALANRDKSLEDMVKQQGLTRGLTDQDLLTPGVTSAQIDREMGIRRKQQDPKKYAKNFTQAFDEPSGQFVSDPETGVERELTMGEYYQRAGGALDLTQEEPTKAAVATEMATQSLRDPRSLFLRDTLGIVPTQPALQLVDAIEQAGIPLDSDVVAPVVTYAAQRPMSKKRLEKALEMLDAAIIEARRTPQQEVVPVVSTPGVSESAGVQPAAAPAVAGLSQGAPVAATPSIAPAGSAAAQITAAPSPAPAAAPAVQEQGAPAATQAVETAPEVGGAVAAWDRYSPDGAPTFDQLSPALQQAWTRATQQGEASWVLAEQVADANREDSSAGVDPRVQLISQLFDGQNAMRNAEMFIDRVAMGMSLKDIGEKYGLSTSAVGKIVGGEKDAVARTQAALSRARARGVDVNAIQDALSSLAEEGRARGELDIQNMFGDVEATEADAAQADLGTRASSVGGGGANIGARLNAVEQRTISVLTRLQAEPSPQRRTRLEAMLARLVEMHKAQERKAQARIRATAGRQSEKDQDLETEQARATARAELGAEDAVQEQTTAEVPVQPEAQAGQGVGRQVRRAQEPTAEGQVLTEAEQAAQAWDAVAAEYPTAPRFADLTEAQRETFIEFGPENWTRADVETELTKLARSAAQPIPETAREIPEPTFDQDVVNENNQPIVVPEAQEAVIESVVEALPDAQVERLEAHYGETRGTAAFMARVREDVATYVNKGAQAVAGAVRSIIKAISEGVLAIGVVFNPSVNMDRFMFDLPGAYAQTIDVRATVPAEAEEKMSALAKSVYERMAPVAEKSGKAFIIADKPNGMIHAFNADGSVIVQDAALYGKDMGDFMGESSLRGGPKVTPAGQFTMKVSKWDSYVGGYTLDLSESYDGTGYIAVHAAYVGNEQENRLGRLASPTAADNRISYGCINTSHETFLNSFLPNIDKFNGGMALVLPDNEALAESMFTGATESVQRTEGTVRGEESRAVAAKEERGPILENVERLTAEPSVYAGDRQRAPSLSRGIATLRRMLDTGKITPEQFTARVEALHDQAKAAKQDRQITARQRGADFIRQRLLEAKRRGDLSERGVAMAEWFILKNPALVADLAVSIRSARADGTSGSYESMRRLMTLVKESSNDETTVHEILHHLERMMPDAMQGAIRKSWMRSMLGAAKAAGKSGDKNLSLFYKNLLDYHMDGDRLGAAAAVKMIKDGLVDYEHYQHVNPSEFWAVNGSRIMEGRFDVSSSALGRIKQWMSEFIQKLKSVFGLKSDAPIIRALDSVIKGDGKFVTGQQMLMEGVGYENITKRSRQVSEINDALARVVNRASQKYIGTFDNKNAGWQAKLHDGRPFGPYEKPVVFVITNNSPDATSDSQHHMFIMSAEGAVASANYSERYKARTGKAPNEVDVAAYFAGQHYISEVVDGVHNFTAAAPDVDSFGADELKSLGALELTGEYWDNEKRFPITKMTGVSYTQLVDSLGQFLAYIKGQTGQNEIPVNWVRLTGANIGKSGFVSLNIERNPKVRQGVTQATTAQNRSNVLQNLNRVPTPARGAASAMSSILGDVGGRVLDRLMFTSSLANRAVSLGMQSAGRLQRTLAARDFMAREEERSIEAVLNGYTNLPESERGAGDGSVNRFLFDSTRAGKWGYGSNADPEMAARFDSFSAEGKKLIQDIFAHGDRMLQRKKDIVLNATRSEFDAQIANAKTDKEKDDLQSAKKATLKRYETLFQIREGRPYAPIKRTGNYVVIAESAEYRKAKAEGDKKALARLEADGDHYHVSFTDGKRAAESLQRQLEAQGSFSLVKLRERDQVTDTLFSNEGAMQQLSALRANVDARVKAGEPEAGKMLNIINQMYLEALAEGSARKSEMRRRGVDGEVDMIASFAQQGRADANFLASLQHADQVNDALNDMRAEAKDAPGPRQSEVLNEMVRRYADSLDVPNNPWLNKLTRLSSIYFLASSPAYYLQNLTQPFMMSVPAMAGEHSYAQANAELFKAYSELGPVMRSAKLLQQLDYSKVPQDVRAAINELVNRGRIDIGLETELGEFQVDGQSKLGAKWNQVDKGLRMAVQKGEAVNRLSTAIAAFRLARSKGKDAAAAIDYADRILLETHGDYSRYNAPRMFNHPVGKIALQFRKFQLIQISWYAKLIKEAYTDPAQRGAALRSLAFGVAHTGVLAGAMGLPGYAAAAWALGMIFGDEDEPFDLTDSIRKMIGDDEVANVVLRGAPTLGGADWSGKIGAGNMLSVMPFSNADLTTRAGFYEAVGTLLGGASAGMVVRGVDGLGLMANGDYMKGAELLLPKGLGDVIKAYRLSTDGATRRNGDVILPADELSGLEAMWQAIGIPPAQMTAMYEKQERVRNTEQRFRDRTSRIKNDYTKAIRGGDSAAAAEAREAWNNLQQARVRAGLKRQPMSELIKAPREQAKRERDTKGGIQFSKANRGLVEDIVER